MKKGTIKKRVLKLAYEKFLRHGFYRVSMDSLVEELRTSKSSLYNHYSSKEDLVKAVIDEINNKINTKLESVTENENLPFKDKLIIISEFTKNYLSKVSDAFLKDLAISTPGIGDYYEQQRTKRIKKYYKRLFETGISEGAVRKDIDLDLILAIYLNLTMMPLRPEYHQLLNMENKNIYSDVQEIFMNGILKDERTSV
ncbi:TetR/AcrR family transcriptional regulator [Allomuricauda sp. CP2A]|jgi:AcrR family transcriptional regulator|uniref:TetR/AcrR family transcriptional regulator n=1 Tax=Allomuricauda sp. CP2A TaxID=1848189 RepID=UPI000836B8CF|nr:TetR/AcrR family transcriptional regulator [Muricauda sp. CP2A]